MVWLKSPAMYSVDVDLHVVKHGAEHPNPETEQLAEVLAKLTGESKTEAVTQALRDRLARLRRERTRRPFADELDEIARHCSRLPVLDARTPDEILGYDEHGLPR